jgi:hypothetical protein
VPSERSDARMPRPEKGCGERGGSPVPRSAMARPERSFQRSVFTVLTLRIDSSFQLDSVRVGKAEVSRERMG